MSKDSVLRFNLNGMDYTLRGDMSEERLQRIVSMVENKIANILEIAPGYSTTRAAVLAALQLAEDVLNAEEENEQMIMEATVGGGYQYRFKKLSDPQE